MNSQNTAAYYDEYYYAHCCGLPYQRNEHWISFFSAIAEKIIIEICPKTVLDAGCAMGFLVEAMRQKGVEAWGVDVSEYAIQNAHPDIQPYCWVGSVTRAFPRKYDLIVCIEVLEHLPPKEAEQAITNFCQHTDDILLSSTPFDYKEATHFNVQPPEYWAEQFAKQGFFRDVDFDASFITPWAVRFRRNREPLHRVLRFYERRFWLLWKENQDIRNSTVEQYNQLLTGEQSVQSLNAKVVDLQSQLQQKQTEIEQLHTALQYKRVELEQSQQTQTELEKLQAQLQHIQVELERERLLLQQKQTEIEQSYTALQHMQGELERSQSQSQQTQIELERSQSQSQQAQIELERSQSQSQQAQIELERSQTQLQNAQVELVRSQATISGMESSKFWKLRTVWFQLKQTLGLTNSKNQTAVVSVATLQSLAPTKFDLPGVNDFSEIKLITDFEKSQNGFFDGLNGSNTTIIKRSKPKTITASGWAILAIENKPADRVIITCGETNLLVAVAPVNLERLDVVEALNNPAYLNSGWSITINSSTLPAGKVILKAWAYSATRKEAIQLNYTNSNLRLNRLMARSKYIYTVLKVKGLRYTLAKVSKKLYQKLDTSTQIIEVNPAVSSNDVLYQQWLSKNFPREADLRKLAETVEAFRHLPVISVIMPVFNSPEQFLREAIESVINQIYPHWELCIADDASTKPYIKQILQEYAEKEHRIKVVFRTENGHISRASNSAIDLATGDFIALLDHDDLLTPDALYEVALLLNRHPEADMIYSDEDKIDEQNRVRDAYFKPDWCPDSFLSRMYTCHLGTYKRSLINEIGRFRAGFEGSQDYDLVLRFTEKTNNIFHIPKILYHWRIHSASTAGSLDNKTYAIDASKKALSEAIGRRGEPGVVVPAPGSVGYYVVRYEIKNKDLVSIIIPTKNLGNILDRCLKSIFEKTKYPNYEVILIDNGSTETITFDVINKWKEKEPKRFRCYPLDIPFNYSKLNNFAVTQSQGKFFLFLNNDTEVVTPDWVDAMVEQAQRPSIGAVGALLLYPDDTIQHAGVVAGIGGVASHSHKHFIHGSPGYFNHVNTINNFSALTAACLMCRRDVFEEVEGFEENLAVAFNDVDLCFKLLEKGYRNIYLPHVILYHYESKSRGIEDTAEKLNRFLKENEYMHNKWNKIIKNDPCYNQHLTKKCEDYSIGI